MGEAKRRRRAAAIRHDREWFADNFRQAVELASKALPAKIEDPSDFATAMAGLYAGRLLALDEVAAVVGPKFGAQCGRGCSACCHILTAVLPFEVFFIAERVINQWDAERRAALIERLEPIAAIEPVAAARWGLACALLVDHECSVYDIRPAVCASHMSADRAACGSPMSTLVPYLMAPRLYKSATQMGLDWVLQVRYGLRTGQVDLARALLHVLRDFDGTFELWLAGGWPFEDCTEVEPGFPDYPEAVMQAAEQLLAQQPFDGFAPLLLTVD
jgi:hypothetical protein